MQNTVRLDIVLITYSNQLILSFRSLLYISRIDCRTL